MSERGVGRNSEAYCAVAPKIGAIRLSPIAPYDAEVTA